MSGREMGFLNVRRPGRGRGRRGATTGGVTMHAFDHAPRIQDLERESRLKEVEEERARAAGLRREADAEADSRDKLRLAVTLEGVADRLELFIAGADRRDWIYAEYDRLAGGT